MCFLLFVCLSASLALRIPFFFSVSVCLRYVHTSASRLLLRPSSPATRAVKVLPVGGYRLRRLGKGPSGDLAGISWGGSLAFGGVGDHRLSHDGIRPSDRLWGRPSRHAREQLPSPGHHHCRRVIAARTQPAALQSEQRVRLSGAHQLQQPQRRQPEQQQ